MTDRHDPQAEIEALRRRNDELEGLLKARERVEEALRESEARYRAILEDQTELICRFLPDGRLTYVNEAYCRYFGKTREELIGNAYAPLIPEEDHAIINAVVTGFSVDRQIIVCEHRVYRPGGSIAWLRWTDRAFYDDEGLIMGFQAVGIDVTERRRADDEVQRLNAELRRAAAETSGELRVFQALSDSMPDGVVLAREDGLISYVNPAYLRMFGLTREVIGRPLLEVHAEERDTLAAVMAGAIGEGCVQEEDSLRGAGGAELRARITAVRVGGAGAGSEEGPAEAGPRRTPAEEIRTVALILRDVSAERQAEAERAELQAQVIEGQRAVIRELSTPLLPLADHVIALPLVGVIDSARAAAALETLLAGVVAYQASTVVLDVTGVSVVDSQVADALIRTARAVRLLGAEVVLTGLQPHVAQTVVTLGIDVSELVTLRSLKDGIAYALRRRGAGGDRGRRFTSPPGHPATR